MSGLLLLVSLLLFTYSCTGVIVNTKYGKIKGYPFITRDQRTVYSFSGIRYAKPPVRSLRFMAPEPPEIDQNIRDVNYSTPCLQYTDRYQSAAIIGEEDCLQLTVYTPSLKKFSRLYPVLVYFHGGVFVEGSGQMEHGAHYMMDHDIVVVQVEYRLGVFGFYTMENELLPGNMGLKDQLLALKWVQENIVLFKGNPNKVTLIGDSAGSASVNYHMISPKSRGLFHGAISESGVATAPWAYHRTKLPQAIALITARLLNCTKKGSSNRTETLLCLQKKNAKDILAVFQRNALPTFDGNPMLLFLPVIDNYIADPFIPDNPLHLESAPVPWLIGCNNLDGFVASQYFELIYQTWNKIYVTLNSLFNKLSPLILLYANSGKKIQVSNKVKEFYFRKGLISERSFANLTNMFSDRHFFFPLMESINLHKGPNFVYNYEFNNTDSYQELSLGKRLLTGAVHGDETIVLWNVTHFFRHELDSTAVKVSKQLVQLFVDFATYGTPTRPVTSSFEWPQWNDETQPYLNIDTEGNFNVEHGYYPKRVQFWTQLRQFSPDIL